MLKKHKTLDFGVANTLKAMEDDFEEYWAAIRPAPKPSINDFREQLLKIDKLRGEEWDLMTHRNPLPEATLEDFLGPRFFSGSDEREVPAS